jgi:hypothetical protein
MADYYSDAVTARAYYTARNYTTPATALDDDAMNAALLVASDFIDSTYRDMFPGLKVGLRAQLREWPRTSAFDTLGYVILPDVIPVELLNAVYEAALREVATPGSLTTDVKLSEVIHSVSVDGAVSVDFASSRETFDADDLQLVMPIIDRIIAPILTGDNGNVSRLSGASIRV